SSLKEATGAKDPDELLKQEGGLELFNRMIEHAVSALDFRLARLRDKLEGLGLSARSRVIGEELGRLVDLGLHDVTPIRRQLIVKQIAQLLGVDEATVASEIRPKRRPFGAPAGATPEP